MHDFLHHFQAHMTQEEFHKRGEALGIECAQLLVECGYGACAIGTTDPRTGGTVVVIIVTEGHPVFGPVCEIGGLVARQGDDPSDPSGMGPQ